LPKPIQGDIRKEITTTAQTVPQRPSLWRRLLSKVPSFLKLLPWALLGLLLAYYYQPVEYTNDIRNHMTKGKYLIYEDTITHQKSKIFLRDEGPPTSEAVILVHGIFTSSFMYRKDFDPISKKGEIRTISFDWPGLGISEKPDINYNWHFLSERILDVVDALNINKAHLVLHGFGGPIGAEFAIRHPNRVASITLVNSFLDLSNASLPFPMSLLRVPYLRQFAWDFFTKSFFNFPRWLLFRWWYSDSIDMETSKAYSYLLHTKYGKPTVMNLMSNANFSQEYNNYIRKGLRERCSNIPMQLIWSEDDAISHLQEHSKYLTENFPNIKREVKVKNSKYLLPEDHPREFSEAVLQFVDRYRTK
jgi:pimeloyl-ACP methyl ester carboxylesterase